MAHQLIFTGEILDGHDVEAVKHAFAQLSKIPPHLVEVYFDGEPRVLLVEHDPRVAHELHQAYTRIGAKCLLKPLKATAITQRKPQRPPPRSSTKILTSIRALAQRIRQKISKDIRTIQQSRDPSHPRYSQKSLGVAYLLWCGCVFGICGLHRFYLRNYITGALYLVTTGFCGLGQFIDLFLIPGKVRTINAEWRILQQITFSPKHVPPLSQAVQEKAIIHLAYRRNGRVTLTEIVAETSLTVEEAERIMANFVNRRLVNVIMDRQGVEIYEFRGVSTIRPPQPPPLPSAQSLPPKNLRCLITGKLLQNTPEERVRQEVAARLIRDYLYAKENMEIEFSIKMGRARKRADLVVFFPNTPHTQGNIYMIVETKPPTIRLEEANEAFAQLQSYIAASMNCHYALLAWKRWDMYHIFTAEGKRKIQKIQDLPRNDQDV